VPADSDVHIFSFGPYVSLAEEDANAHGQQEINAGELNARFIKPLDEEYLHKVGQADTPLVIVEESMLTGGLGSMTATFLSDHHYTNKIKRIGIDNEYIEHGDVNLLLEDIGITAENIK